MLVKFYIAYGASLELLSFDECAHVYKFASSKYPHAPKFPEEPVSPLHFPKDVLQKNVLMYEDSHPQVNQSFSNTSLNFSKNPLSTRHFPYNSQKEGFVQASFSLKEAETLPNISELAQT